jgi:drug/metabolite transporter (DMT)-like permease
MNKRALRADILLLLTAGIWGFGFVAQRSGMEYVGPFAYNGIRFILGSLCLLPLIFIRQKANGNTPFSPKKLLWYSLAAGTCLFIAVILQQFGIMFTTAGNAGFITGLYVVLTPIFGIFLGRKTGPATWLGSVFTAVGLYFLCTAGSLDSINPGDIITIVSAVFWACHVLLIDRLVRGDIDPIMLSSGQFAVCGIFAFIGAFLVEPFVHQVVGNLNPELLEMGTFAWLPFPDFLSGLYTQAVSFPIEAIIPILYGGLGSVGIAYTLQVVAQRDAPPAHATIILCFEGCFAAIGGALLLSEKIGLWTLLGFVLMLAGMLVTQWEVIAKGERE